MLLTEFLGFLGILIVTERKSGTSKPSTSINRSEFQIYLGSLYFGYSIAYGR